MGEREGGCLPTCGKQLEVVMQQVDRDEVLQPRDGGPRVAGRLAQHHGVVVLLDRLQHRAHLDHRVARHHWRGQHHHTLRTTSPD